MSLSFSQGTVYLGLEQTPEWDDGSGAMDMDAGGMVLGYNHPVHMSEDGKYVLSFGTSINMSDMMITGADNATNDRMGYLAWYALPMWNFNENFMQDINKMRFFQILKIMMLWKVFLNV